METLVDADLASNSMNWQWVSGSGPDAAPYFRIFNPILQSEKFDKNGDYIRKFVPELKKLNSKWIHAPWLAPPEVLKALNITLGKDYPYPLVDHSEARDKALSIFNALT
jgi:deoxyribodipyrimidine photo-lyase